MTADHLKISVIIPVRNGVQTLDKCLTAIRSQTVEVVEIIILDTNSSDESCAIAKKYGAKVVAVLEEEFGHARTRNLGCALSKGDLIYYTVQDAWLASDDSLKCMTEHFSDSEIAAVCGKQAVPHEIDKNPALWFSRQSKPKITKRHFEKNGFQSLTLSEQFKNSSWDNVNAMYRKSVLEDIPFRDSPQTEDWLWAKDALSAGKTLLVDDHILVYHYHHHTGNYTSKNSFMVNYVFYKEFKVLPGFPSFFSLIQRINYVRTQKRLNLGEKLKWSLHNISIFTTNIFSAFYFRCCAFMRGEKGLDKMINKVSKMPIQGSQKKLKEITRHD